MPQQNAMFSANRQLQGDIRYFSDNASRIGGADDILGDYRLRSVILTAFGLADDINNRYFIKKVLESNPDDRTSLAGRLSDKRYANLSRELGLWRSDFSGFSSRQILDISEKFQRRSFEKAVGKNHSEIELAMNAQRELPEMAKSASSNDAKWYQILASKPLRKVFEGAFGWSAQFMRLPIDRQLAEVKNASERFFGTSDLSRLALPENLDKLLTRYLVMQQNSEDGRREAPILTLFRG